MLNRHEKENMEYNLFPAGGFFFNLLFAYLVRQACFKEVLFLNIQGIITSCWNELRGTEVLIPLLFNSHFSSDKFGISKTIS